MVLPLRKDNFSRDQLLSSLFFFSIMASCMHIYLKTKQTTTTTTTCEAEYGGVHL
jgi:hypothetical protein